MGGIAAVFVVRGINPGVQFIGIGITILLALVSGYIVGLIILALGRVKRFYDDSVEIIEMEQD
jgi:hypothetical protein